MQIEQKLLEFEELEKQRLQIQMQQRQIELALLEHMLAESIEEVKLANAELKLSIKRGRKKQTNCNQEELQALELAIKQEQAEMESVNKKQIYAIERDMQLLQAELNKLRSNVWIQELKFKQAKLSEAAKAAKAQAPESMQLQIKLKNSLSVLDYIDADLKDKMLKEGQSLKATTGKAITKALVRQFVEAFNSGKYGALSLESAWEARKQEHISYLQGGDD